MSLESLGLFSRSLSRSLFYVSCVSLNVSLPSRGARMNVPTSVKKQIWICTKSIWSCITDLCLYCDPWCSTNFIQAWSFRTKIITTSRVLYLSDSPERLGTQICRDFSTSLTCDLPEGFRIDRNHFHSQNTSLNIRIYMYIYILMNVIIYMYVYIHISVYIHIYVYIYIYEYKNIDVCIYKYIYIYI